MKKLFSILFFSVLMMSCQSQKITNEGDKNKIDYFLGSWRFIQKNYKDGNEAKIYPLHECMKEYELIFKKENQKAIMTKTFATGKDCKSKSQSEGFPVTINESSISYTEYDLKKTEQYKIYSKTKFSIIYNDIIEGKVTEIEDVYQKK